MSEQDIYIEAMNRQDGAERCRFLDQACGEDKVLRARLEKLIQHSDRMGSFLESPPANLDATAAIPVVTEAVGTIIGPYKLLQQIGEGGMGTVFMAEQTHPVERKVALKVIKPGMDSRQVISRFEAERQALAMMDHVNIARVLDAGATPDGLPYFVMELVHGVPITKYCDDNHLTPRQRLELFVPVCQAIQHAHQKGIIHRDIKPSNVMVTLYDGKPVPKVIDFGVAKATEQRLTERTLFTQYGTMVGTLEYMSPEQAEMSALGADTRSDIYSLGVLLYELLTGSTPLSNTRMKEAAYAEILRMIKEEEPPKPSTRLSESGEALASISAQRQMEPAKLTKLMRGELDWIVMKSLEKDRNRRYETANGLAQDIGHYLADEQVQACPPSAAYRFRKLARRHKAAIWTAGLVAIAMCVGTAVSTWQAVRATSAETLAQARLESERRSREQADEARRDAESQSELAHRERDRASDAERRTRRHLRAAQLNLAAAAASRGDLAETMTILESQRSDGGAADSRGFGWHYLWRLCHEGHRLTLRGHGDSVSSVKFSSDATLLASGSADGTVRLWDAMTGRVRSILTTGTGAIGSIAISPDGGVIAVGSEDGTVSLWNAATATRKMSSRRHERAVRCVAFSPDGKLIVSTDAVTKASLQSAGEIVICETVSGREVARHAEAGFSVAFSPDGSTLAVAQGFGGLKLVDASSGQVRRNLFHRMGVLGAAFSPDGKSVASASSDGVVKVWDVATGQMQSSPRGGSTMSARSIVFSADGTRLACGRDDGIVDLWELASGRVRTRAHGAAIRSVAFSPDGALLASGSDDGTIMLWDAEFRPEASPVDGHTGIVWSVTFSPDGRTLASTSDDHTVKMWDVASGQVRATLKGHTENIMNAAFSPDGRMLASASDDRTVRLWDVATGQTLAVLQGHTRPVFAVAFSPDGQALASGSGDTTVKIWDLAAKSERATLTGHVSGVWSVAFSPDGKTLASAGLTDDVRLWDISSASLVRTVPDTSLFVNFSRDGKTLETRGSTDHSVVLWDLAARTARAKIAKGMVAMLGRNVAFSRDGSGLVVSRGDGGIREIDTATEEERVLLPGDGGPAWAVAFSPDGRAVVSGSWSGQVRFWRAASEQEVLEQGAGAGTESDTPTTQPATPHGRPVSSPRPERSD